MTLNTQTKRTTRSVSLLLAIFASLFYNQITAHALYNAATLPAFADFVKAVQNGDSKTVRGVYVDHVFALPIVQQPSGSPAFVSRNDGEITQFGMAAQYGNVGLLAHNDLSGKLFSDLSIGDRISLVYGNGKSESFVITRILRYQALQPNSPYSSFSNIEKNDETLTAEQMFKNVYLGKRHVTFQTCITAYGNPSWGRLFVIAKPQSESSSLDWKTIGKNQ